MPAWHRQPWLRAFCTGVQFLTRLPIPGGASADPTSFAEDAGRSLVFFPLIGCLIGGATSAVLWLCTGLWPLSVAVLLAISVEVLLTGALHEDAVADFCDAFGGGRTREDVLRILKDSRIGSFGLVGLGLLFSLRITALVASEDLERAMTTLVISGTLGRLAMLIIMASVPPVWQGVGLVGSMSEKATWREAIQATALISPILVWAAWIDLSAFLAVLALGFGFILWFARFLRTRLGGSTGDCVGTVGYASALLATLVFSAKG